jgi:hypothetical protein
MAIITEFTIGIIFGRFAHVQNAGQPVLDNRETKRPGLEVQPRAFCSCISAYTC